ncbi:MAG: ABC transporter permease [Bacteroidota bacterium]
MHNILLILKHEYITRVSKKSFVIMTLLGPLLISAFYGTIAFISIYQFSNDKQETIAIYDPQHVFNNNHINSKSYQFEYVSDIKKTKSEIEEESLAAVLMVNSKSGDSIELIAKKSFSLTNRQELKDALAEHLFQNNLKANGITKSQLDSLRTDIKLTENLLSGKSSSIEAKSGVGYVGAMVIYLFIFMYGVMIMRGVTEEKNNRIVEIIVSSVKPFQLMMGKILGVALVGLTQFLAWIVLSGILITVVSIAIGLQQVDSGSLSSVQSQIPSGSGAGMMSSVLEQFHSLDYPKIITGFIIFFFGGFLLYSAIFAAIGSAVDSDTETQQFMFPVSMPLVFGLVIAQIAVIKDPNSTLAYWCSYIPFTSPVVMMVRLPFDVSWGQIILSAIILFGTFVITVWLAGKIYRIGILSYGQKASYKQMFKWLFQK